MLRMVLGINGGKEKVPDKRQLVCDSCNSKEVGRSTIAGGIHIYTCGDPDCGAIWGDDSD